MAKLSIVAALYKSESTIIEFIERCISVSEKVVGQSYEILLVDDGSPDNSFRLASTFARKNKKIKLIRLSKNYGQHQALFVGFKRAKGTLVFTLDSDLEEPPETLEKFYKFMLTNKSCDVLGAVQLQRKGKFSEIFFGRLFYSLSRVVFDYSPVPNQLNMFLMKTRVVQQINTLPNGDLTLIGAMNAFGFKPNYFEVKKLSTSATSYKFSSKIKLAFKILSSHVQKPIKILTIISLGLGAGSVLVIFWLLIKYLLGFSVLGGWSSLFIIILFWGSFISILQSITLLILAEILNHQRGINKVVESEHVNCL